MDAHEKSKPLSTKLRTVQYLRPGDSIPRRARFKSDVGLNNFLKDNKGSIAVTAIQIVPSPDQ